MKEIILCFLLFTASTISMNAQELLGPMFELNQTQEIVTDIESITTLHYSIWAMDENQEVDTLIIVKNDSVAMYLQEMRVETYSSPGTMIFTGYNHLNEEEYTRKTIQDKEGRAIESELKYSDAATAAIMDKNTSYEYENGYISKIINNDVEAIALQYDEQNLPITVKMNMGFMSMDIKRNKNETGYKYDTKMVLNDDQEGLGGMMADAMGDTPIMYILYELKNKNQHYTYIEEDPKTGERTKEDLFVRNPEGQLIETKSKYVHKKFKYNKKGEIMETLDVSSNTKTTNEIDKHHNIITKYENQIIFERTFNDKNRMLEEREYSNNPEKSLSGLKISKIVYK